MTLRQFFDLNPWIVQVEIARKCKINEALFRQYATGIKKPSIKRIALIERTIKDSAKGLKDFKLTIE